MFHVMYSIEMIKDILSHTTLKVIDNRYSNQASDPLFMLSHSSVLRTCE